MPSKFKKKNYKKKSKSNYRKSIPRTIQIATRRNMSQTLRFVVNQTYVYDGSVTPNGKTAFLAFRANSIFNCQLPNSTNLGEWKSQSPLVYDNYAASAIHPNATGWDEWTQRYQHFTVTGSKMSYTFEPINTGIPSILFCHLAGTQGAIDTNTNSASMNLKPFMTRKSIIPVGAIKGIRGSMNYSARKFEGVTDPDDNSNLRGRFANTALGTVGTAPSEQTIFYLAHAPVDPNSSAGKMASGVFRIKIEYVVHLREPTETNQVQVTTGTASSPGGDEL